MVGNSNRWIVIRDFGAGNYIRILKITTQYSPHPQVLLNFSLYNGCRHSTTQLRPHSTLFAFRPPMTARDFFRFTIKVNGRLEICSHIRKWPSTFQHLLKLYLLALNQVDFFDSKLLPNPGLNFMIKKRVYFISSQHQTKKTLLHHSTHQILRPTTDVWIV